MNESDIEEKIYELKEYLRYKYKEHEIKINISTKECGVMSLCVERFGDYYNTIFYGVDIEE
jgi:hypothetical protein